MRKVCFAFQVKRKRLIKQTREIRSFLSVLYLGSARALKFRLYWSTRATHSISEGSIAHIWVRADGAKNKVATDSENSCIPSGLSTDAPSSQASRQHMPADVKTRMKSLCNLICPRSEDGVMLICPRRPAWCIAEVMKILRT